MRNRLIALLVLFTVVIFSSAQAQTTARKFEAGKNTFLLDGEPFVVKAAELHYTRIPQAYWEHRMSLSVPVLMCVRNGKWEVFPGGC